MDGKGPNVWAKEQQKLKEEQEANEGEGGAKKVTKIQRKVEQGS